MKYFAFVFNFSSSSVSILSQPLELVSLHIRPLPPVSSLDKMTF